MDDQPRSASREWDAATYHRVSTPQFTWGQKVLAQLPLHGNETVLDAGCGTGRLTFELGALLPAGRVVGLDISQNMLREARDRVPVPLAGRAFFVAADLQDLPFTERFDGIFSTAAFHWVLDHDRLFGSLFGALRPGGWLCAQCGGGANLARLRGRAFALAASQPYAHALQGFTPTWEYADAATTRQRLQHAGFTDIETNLEEARIRFQNGGEFREFVATVILRQSLERIHTAELREKFLAELTRQAANDVPPYELDYWRLNMRARKPGAAVNEFRELTASKS